MPAFLQFSLYKYLIRTIVIGFPETPNQPLDPPQPITQSMPRVSEEAKLFPIYLHFEMLSKSDLWPKCFNTSDPSDDDMHFFPSEAM